MKLLLLGCTGFIGQELIPRLLLEDHELIIISRQESDLLKNIPKNEKISHLQLDPSISSSWKNPNLLEELKTIEGIINLVGEPIAEKRWNNKQCQLIQNSRVNTTKHLIKAINGFKEPPNLLINASAIGFYGSSQEQTFDEDSNQGKDFLAELCNEWEQSALKKPDKTRLLIIRIGIVLSEEGGALKKMLPIFRAGLGGPIGTGAQWMSWIHRSDLCEMIIKALVNKSWEGRVNAVAPNPISMSSFSKALGQSLNRPSLFKVPEFILKLLVGDGAKIVLEGQKVISNRLDKLNYKFIYPNISLALKTISPKK